jgi:NADH-ubiquinone oxidoreductase chain 6
MINSMAVIVSVLFLISLFLVIAVYLITIGVHFIGLAYLLVYIGAISILFLFTIMLINVRMTEITSHIHNSLALAFIFSLVLFYVLSSPLSSNGTISSELDIDFSSSYKWDGVLVSSSDIQSIGNTMYSSHGIWLIITGVILLLAMVGTITITLGSSSKTYNQTKGLSRQTFIQKPAKSHKSVPKQRRHYSTLNSEKTAPDSANLNSSYVTGFLDAEGCFRVNLTIDPKRTSGMRMVPSLSVHLDKRDIALLYRIKNYSKEQDLLEF